MIGKFTGQDTWQLDFPSGLSGSSCCCWNGDTKCRRANRKAFDREKLPAEKLLEVLEEARKEREAGRQVMIVNMKKNKKFQEQLAEQGYTDITEVYNG